MDNNCELTIEKLAPLIQRKKISPVELTQFLLDRISKFQPSINAYLTVTAENAIAQARRAEKEIVRGRYRGMLHGIPVSLKDLFYTQKIRTTAGSKILARHVPEQNATVVDRLFDAGCILLGKTNLHEFAYGPTNLNPHYGPVRNPWDLDRMSGGSSGGSAASVISALAIASLGTDTGGSIRIPASACGCVGFKPTYGRVPTEGVIPLSFSLDHVGPLSRCVMDAAFLFEAIADPSFRSSNPRRFIGGIRRGVRSFRVGIPRQYFFDRIQPEVRKTILTAIGVFEQLGACICEVEIPGMKDTARLAAEITGDEAVSFHERWLQQRSRDYGEDVRTRLEPNRKTTAVAYIHALQAKRAYAARFEKALESVCLLLAPTLPIIAPPLDQTEVRIGKSSEDIRLALLRLTRPGNLSGLPAISIPCGFSSQGLPIGLQLIGRRLDEATVLRAAYAYETVTPWHKQFPSDANYRIPVIPSRQKPNVLR